MKMVSGSKISSGAQSFKNQRFSSPASTPPTKAANKKLCSAQLNLIINCFYSGARVVACKKTRWRRELQSYFLPVPVLCVPLRLKEHEINAYPLRFW